MIIVLFLTKNIKIGRLKLLIVKTELKMDLELKKLPKHLGIIIDGNGRWAQEKGLPRSLGHQAGLKTLEKILKECFFTHNIPYVSIYAFSTENWNRPQKEVDFLMDLFRKYFKKNMEKKYPEVKINIMGDLNDCPDDIKNMANQLMEKTKDNNKYTFNLAFNYGGQQEIVKAVNNVLASGKTNISKEEFEQFLYTKGEPPLDFVIRTSGEQRLSNFMLWQVAYAELYFTQTNWPAFNKKHLVKALFEYQKRDRRFGAIKK